MLQSLLKEDLEEVLSILVLVVVLLLEEAINNYKIDQPHVKNPILIINKVNVHYCFVKHKYNLFLYIN